MGKAAEADRELKLLLDEMHAPSIGEALQSKGFDVVPVAGISSALKSLSDPDLLSFAATMGRAVVTENIVDFRGLADAWAANGRQHGGIVYTLNSRFPRATAAYPRSLIRSLQRFLEKPPALTQAASWEWWLEPVPQGG
jgi:hypothetical protein